MQSIQSNSIPLKEIISDLAKQLDTDLIVNCDEYALILPKAIGVGTIKGINFPEGLGIILYDCTFKEDMEIQFIVDKIHPLKFMFCEKGSLKHRFENESIIHRLDLQENIIVASSSTNGHILQFKAAQKTIINSLEIDREVFIRSMDCELKNLEGNLQDVFRDTSSIKDFYHHGSYCIKMADLFTEMEEFTELDFLRYIFLQGSAFKILTLQILQYIDDITIPEYQSVLRKFEMKLIMEASAIINNEILDFKTVRILGHRVGLNTNKLQNGFKTLYATTVNGYVLDRRMDIASGYLKESDYSISEIVERIGLSSKSHFSKIFKDKYGKSPSTFRMSHRKEKLKV